MRIEEGKLYEGKYTGVTILALESTNDVRFEGEVIDSNGGYEIGEISEDWHSNSFTLKTK